MSSDSAVAKLAVGYVRTSSEDPGLAEEQACRVRSWGKTNSVELVMLEEHGRSAFSNDAHLADRLIAATRVHGRSPDFVVVDDLSRLSRDVWTNLSIVARLEHAGMRVVSLSEATSSHGGCGQ